MELLIHSQTSSVQPVKFRNGLVIPFYTLMDMWLLSHIGIKASPYDKIGQRSQIKNNTLQPICSMSPCFSLIRSPSVVLLTHWDRVAHLFVGNLTTIASDNCLPPGRHQAITWIKVGMLSNRPTEIYFSVVLIEIRAFSSKETHLKMSSENTAAILSRPQCVNHSGAERGIFWDN